MSALLTVAAAALPLISVAQVKSSKDEPKEPTQANAQDNETGVTKLNPYIIKEEKVVDWNSQMTFSGRRTAGELLELPTSISIATSEFIKDIGATNLLGVLQYAGSGVTNRVAYREDFTVRGFRQAPLRDGTPYPNYGFLTMYDIEKIEIIKGPTALMFNSYGNISGGVNFVTKDPTAVPKADASLTVGNYDTYIASATARGPLTADGKLRYRVTAGRQWSGGWQGHGTDSNNYNNNTLVSASVDWYATSKLLVRFSGGLQREQGRSYGSGIIDPVTGKVAEFSANGFSLGTSWSYFDLDTERFSIEGIWSVSPELTLRARATSYMTFWDYNQPTAQGAATDILRPSEYPNYVNVYNVYAEKFPYTTYNQNSYVDATWIKQLGEVKNQLSTGFNYFQNDSDYELYDTLLAPFAINAPVSSRPGAPNTLQPSGSGPQVQAARSVVRNGGWSAYAQDTVSMLQGRLIFAGGMLWVTKGTNNQAKAAAVPNYGTVYRINKDISVYGSYGESFVPRTGVDGFGTPLVNQKGTSKEVGVKFNAFNERLFGTITYFDILNDNVLIQVLGVNQVGQTVFGNRQVGNQTNKGFEVDIGWVQAVGPGNWSTYGTVYEAEPKTERGLQPSRAVKTKYTLFSKYKFATGPAKGFEIGGGYSAIGSSPGVGFPLLPAYELWSGLIGYEMGRYRIMLNVDNLADKHGIMTGAEAPGLLALNPPRTWKLTTTWTW
ncbi:MAG: TonB-dependent receptor [Opitutaceae bacterium]|nr:TonB-dependent receptor [Opitutaceae bacterium]